MTVDPSQLVAYADIHQRKVREFDTSQVRVMARYLAIPRPVWAQIGSPSRVAFRFCGFDLIIFPGPERQVDLSLMHSVRLWYDQNGKRGWSTALMRGCYPYHIDEIKDVGPCLRVVGCNLSDYSRLRLTRNR